MSFAFTPGNTRQKPIPPAFYPVRGFLYLAHNYKTLAGPILSSAIKASVLSLLAVVPLVKYGFGPQSRLLSKLYLELRPQDQAQWFLGPGMALTATILTFVESFAIMGKLGDHFVGSVRDRFFDAILAEHNALPAPKKNKKEEEKNEVQRPEALVESLNVAVENVKKEIVPKDMEDAKAKAHKLLSPVHIMTLYAQSEDSWKLFILKPVLFLVSLPLNLIPVIGPVAFIGIQGLTRGGQTHKRYFDLYEWTAARRQRQIEQAFWQYHQFGVVASVLEMIPFAGFVFSYTNHIGAAMWVMDLKASNNLESRTFFDLFKK
ncbi:hypothetical protein BDB00DRAFT_132054 [Zychaea mexicana]|uniref:uncharacterized protein n=1 Tax=Zychaea mexicana TaxID=64656 RepID=UPI0022FDFA85|nr:uncharacterized protein BDB00DRAFT_132054 [Zychaea mexicana]KAI9484501.1 hypothetical protein BDB00DRAFT_132054 [Zychaea mexicana]